MDRRNSDTRQHQSFPRFPPSVVPEAVLSMVRVVKVQQFAFVVQIMVFDFPNIHLPKNHFDGILQNVVVFDLEE